MIGRMVGSKAPAHGAIHYQHADVMRHDGVAAGPDTAYSAFDPSAALVCQREAQQEEYDPEKPFPAVVNGNKQAQEQV